MLDWCVGPPSGQLGGLWEAARFVKKRAPFAAACSQHSCSSRVFMHRRLDSLDGVQVSVSESIPDRYAAKLHCLLSSPSLAPCPSLSLSLFLSLSQSRPPPLSSLSLPACLSLSSFSLPLCLSLSRWFLSRRHDFMGCSRLYLRVVLPRVIWPARL